MERKSHILYIASWYPARNAPALGNFIQQHARAAAIENKISVVYASADKTMEEGAISIEENHSGNLSEYIAHYGKVYSGVPLLGKLKKRNAYKDAIKAGVEAATKKEKADLLHVHVIWPAAVAVLPLLDELKIPLVISEHWSGYLPEDGNYKGIIQKNISKRLADKAEHITAVSQRMIDAMKSHGLGKSFSLLPNAVDTNTFHYKENETRQNTSGIKLLHVSMLVDREKNISGLLRVMKDLEFHPDISLEFIGDGPERERFERMTGITGTLGKSIIFRGFCNATQIAIAMQDADALVMFSNFEGMPVTIIEAQCCGLPVIATKVGYIPNMVNDSQGMLVDAGDEEGLKNAILEFRSKKNTFDRKKISAEAMDKYSLQAVGQELNNLYASILKPDGK